MRYLAGLAARMAAMIGMTELLPREGHTNATLPQHSSRTKRRTRQQLQKGQRHRSLKIRANRRKAQARRTRAK